MPFRQRLIAPLRDQRLLSYLFAILARGLEVVGKFGLYFLAARKLGGHDSGLFFLCLTWVNFLSTAARLGLERATTRHVAAELAIGRGQAAARAAWAGMVTVTLASLAAAGLTWAVAGPVSDHLFHQPELAAPLAFSALILPPQTALWGVAFVLVGLSRGVAAQLLLSALPPLLSLAALLAGLNRLTPLLGAYALSNTVCCLAGLAFLAWDWRRKMVDRPMPKDVTPEPLPRLWQSAKPFYLVEMAQITLTSLPIFALQFFTGLPLMVSEFSIASRASNLVNSMILSIGLIAAPRFAQHHRLQEFRALRRTNRNVQLLSILLCLPPILIMLVVPKQLLLLLGSEFGQAWPALVVLAIGQLVSCILPCQDTLLAMTGHGRVLSLLNLLQLFVCIVLSVTLVPAAGLMGAAITSAACLAVYAAGCALAARRLVVGPMHSPGIATP